MGFIQGSYFDPAVNAIIGACCFAGEAECAITQGFLFYFKSRFIHDGIVNQFMKDPKGAQTNVLPKELARFQTIPALIA